MLQAKYPIIGSKEFFEIVVEQPEVDPQQGGDYRCQCKLLAPNYKKKFYTHGVDEIQCVWLALRQIRVEIAKFEKKKKMESEYYYFEDPEREMLIYKLHKDGQSFRKFCKFFDINKRAVWELYWKIAMRRHAKRVSETARSVRY